MLRKSVLQLFICILVLGSCAKTVPPELLVKETPPDLLSVFISASEKVKDSVVEVKAAIKKSSGSFRWVRGSGVIIASEKVRDGYESFILTNWHVVEEASKILVLPFASRSYVANLHGWHQPRDLALLKIKTPGPLVMARLGDSEILRVGEWVFALGNPYGASWSLSIGVIGNLSRDPLLDLIHYDGAVNPGSSGGGLFNLRGELVGVTFLTKGGTKRIGYAISIKMVKQTLPALLKGGEVAYSFLGVEFSDIESIEEKAAQEMGISYPLALDEGVVITDISAGGPGAKAGLAKGDIVLAINNVEVKNSLHGYQLIIAHSPDQKMSVKILRGKDKLVLDVMPAVAQQEKAVILDILPGVP